MELQAGRRTALITGASAGIGAAFADVFARSGHDLVLVARRADRLEALALSLHERYGITARAAPLDLADPRATAALGEWLAGQGVVVDALVNNAGYGVTGGFADNAWKTHADFLQVLGTSVLELCHFFIPGMRSRGYGRIINVASLAAYLPGTANATLYAGIKALIVKASQAMSRELSGTGVHVTAVCPGLTRSEFHSAMGEQERYDRIPGFLWMEAEPVAVEGFDAVMRGKPVVITGGVNKVAALILRGLPESWLMGASGAVRGR